MLSSRSVSFFTTDFTLAAAADTEPDAVSEVFFDFTRMICFFGAAAGASSSPRRISSNSAGSFASAIASAADALLRFTGSSEGKNARLPNLIGASATASSGLPIPISCSNSLRRTVIAEPTTGATNLLENDRGITPRRDAANFAIIAARSISEVWSLFTSIFCFVVGAAAAASSPPSTGFSGSNSS